MKNREIKFRGYKDRSEPFVYGSLAIKSMRWGSKNEIITLSDDEEEGDIITHIHPESIGQFTGLVDKRNNRDVYELDIYFEEDAQYYGDRRIFFVITWIAERCAFAMLEITEYGAYVNNGFDAIERDFDGFYFELMQSSIDKMHYAGDINHHPDLLTPTTKERSEE